MIHCYQKDILNKVKEKYPLVIYEVKVWAQSTNYCVDPKEVFHKNYPYKCGMTKEVVSHHENIAIENIKKFKLKRKELVLDIGSNDGTLLALIRKKE